jgi:hypothetical protein
VSEFLTDDGVYPRSMLATPRGWSLFNLAGDATTSTCLILGGTLATAAFTLGVQTRAASIACWIFWVSIHRRVPIIRTGGDAIADIMLFFGIFADLSGRWSIDALRRGKRAEVRAFVPRLMQAIPAFLYLETARMKWLGAGSQWLFGPIVFQHMHGHGWLRPLGVLLGQFPMLCALATGATILMEFAIPLFYFSPVWIRPARRMALASHLLLQLGILLTLKTGVFTLVMLALTFLWLPPEWLDKMGKGRMARAGAKGAPPWTPVRLALCAVLGVLFFGVVALPAMPRHLPPLLGVVTHEWCGLDLTIGLFTRGFTSMRWEAAGVRSDGSAVDDPLSVAAPGIDLGNGPWNSQWMQLPYNLEEFAPLGRFVCDRFNRSERPPLASWQLSAYARPPYTPEEAPPRETRKLVWAQRCEH